MNKLEIVETAEYILGVCDEQILEEDFKQPIIVTNKIDVFKLSDVIDCSLEYANQNWKKVKAYKAKSVSSKLDLPLLPTQEDEEDIEKMAMDELKNKWSHLYISGYPKKPFPSNYQHDLDMIMLGYYKAKANSKVYTEEDIRLALQKGEELSRLFGSHKLKEREDFIQSLKQSKMKWFIAEMEYKDMMGGWYLINDTVRDSVMKHFNLPVRFKTVSIAGNEVLVGRYKFD